MKKRKIVRFAEKKEQANWIECPFCSDHRKIPVDPDWVEQHLIVIQDKSFHYHVHGPIGDKEAIKHFILNIAKEAKIDIEDEDEDEDEGGGKKDEPRIIETKKLQGRSKKIIEEDSTIPDETA